MSTSEDLASEAPGGAREIRFLNIIAIVAIIDFLLLIPLVWASRFITKSSLCWDPFTGLSSSS